MKTKRMKIGHWSYIEWLKGDTDKNRNIHLVIDEISEDYIDLRQCKKIRDMLNEYIGEE